MLLRQIAALVTLFISIQAVAPDEAGGVLDMVIEVLADIKHRTDRVKREALTETDTEALMEKAINAEDFDPLQRLVNQVTGYSLQAGKMVMSPLWPVIGPPVVKAAKTAITSSGNPMASAAAEALEFMFMPSK